MKRSARFSLSNVVICLIFLAISDGLFREAIAQPQLNLKRLVDTWPAITLYFSVECGGQPAYFKDKQFFKVHEDSVEINEFTLWCPDLQVKYNISVSLVFDASGSMAGAGNAGAKAAGNTFVDLMDGVTDEAAVLWFNTAVTVALGMTTSKSMLKTAINSLPASGGTAVWNGIYDGAMELIANGANNTRAVIALTDGVNNAGAKTPSECIYLANRHLIRIYTIGLGGTVDSASLKSIADQTGGLCYFTDDPVRLTSIMQEIYAHVSSGGTDECILRYTAKCKDGNLRNVDLSLINFCGGSDTKTGSYIAPEDTTTFVPLTVRLGNAIARANTNTRIPLSLETVLNEDVFHRATFTVLFDQKLLQFSAFDTPSGTLLHDVPTQITPIQGGVVIQTMGGKSITGTGVLGELSFKALDPKKQDTVTVPVRLGNWRFDAGCFTPDLINGEIRIAPYTPSLIASCVIPDSLIFDHDNGLYIPNPFDVTVDCINVSAKDAENVRATILLPSGIELANPGDSLTKYFNPSTFPPYQGGPKPSLTWKVRHKALPYSDVSLPFRFLIKGEGAGGAWIDSAQTVCSTIAQGVPPTFSARCHVVPDSLSLNASKTGVEPNPFMVTWKIYPTGWQSVFITNSNIHFTGDGITLDPSTPQTQILDTLLHRGDTLLVSWIVHVQNRSVDRTSVLTVTAYGLSTNPAGCVRAVFIPAVPATLSCAVKPDNFQILYDRDKQEYVPKEWVISQSLTAGVIPLNNVRGTISWTDPSGLNLVDWNPAFPDNSNPKLRSFLQANDSVLFEWGFMMKNPNTSGKQQTITFEVLYSSDEMPQSSQQKCASVAVIDTQITVGVERSARELSYRLYQNHPNPFNPSTVIEYEVPEATHVRLAVYDALGREVRTLVNERKEAGRHGIVFHSGDLPSGVYTCKIETVNYVESRKMILMR